MKLWMWPAILGRPVRFLGLVRDKNECGSERADNRRCKESAFAGLERSMPVGWFADVVVRTERRWLAISI